LAFGGQYRLSKATAIDFGYAHLFVPSDPTVNQCGAAQVATYATQPLVCGGKNAVVGNYSNNVNIVSLQLRMNF